MLFGDHIQQKQDRPKPVSKAQQHLKKKLFTEDTSQDKINKKLRELEKKKQLQKLLVEKGIRLPQNIDGDYNASDFTSKLVQKTTIANMIPFLGQPIEKIKIKAAVFEDYHEKYKQRLNDFQSWFLRKINFQKQTVEQFRQRQRNVEKQLIKSKQSCKQVIKEGDNDQKYDNLQDLQQFEIKQQLQPTLITITQNAYRCVDFEQLFTSVSQLYLFFTRHYPIAAVVDMINNGAYQNCKFMISTTSRLLKLAQVGAIDFSNLKHIVLDCSYADDKDQTPFEYDNARSDLRVFMNLIKEDAKVWIL